METKLARWRLQAEQLRLQDKDSAASRARASRLSCESSEDSIDEDLLGDALIGGPRGSARRTVVERMRELKMSERRAELSADVQKLRDEEELSDSEREEREQKIETERLRLKKEIEADSLKWAEKKNSYWKTGIDSTRDVPPPDRSVVSRLAQELAVDKVGIAKRPNEKITAKLNQWREMSAERKARQVGRVSVDLAVTVLNAVAILMGIILQRPVEVPTTSFKGDAIRAAAERIKIPFWGKRTRTTSSKKNTAPEKAPAKVPTWSDLTPAVTKVVQASDAAAVADIAEEYQQSADEEADYLQRQLREKWRLKAEAAKNIKRKSTAPEAFAQMKTLIAKGVFLIVCVFSHFFFLGLYVLYILQRTIKKRINKQNIGCSSCGAQEKK